MYVTCTWIRTELLEFVGASELLIELVTLKSHRPWWPVNLHPWYCAYGVLNFITTFNSLNNVLLQKNEEYHRTLSYTRAQLSPAGSAKSLSLSVHSEPGTVLFTSNSNLGIAEGITTHIMMHCVIIYNVHVSLLYSTWCIMVCVMIPISSLLL